MKLHTGMDSRETHLNTTSKLGMTFAKRYPSRPSRVGRNRKVRLVTQPLLLEKTLDESEV